MPPLLRQRPEAVAHHRLTQDHAIAELRGVDFAVRRRGVARELASVFAGLGVSAPVGVALLAEPVEGAAHVNLLLRCRVEERQVNGAASAVAGMLHEVTSGKEVGLVQIGVEIRLHPRVGGVFRPVHEVDDGALGTIGVVDFQTIAVRPDIVAYHLQRLGGLRREQCGRAFIAVDACSHEVVGGVVADFQKRVRDDLLEMHEAVGNGVFRRI